MIELPANKANIKKAAEIIKSGGLVAFPTETVYGLGANAFNPIAVSKIFEAKKRPFFDPLIVHIATISTIGEIADGLDPIETKLAETFWPGPLTLVLPKHNSIPDIVTAGLPTVAVRMPANEIARELILEAGVPVAAPSANLFGRVSPTEARHVANQLGKNIDMILDGGKCEIGMESTILKIEDGVPFLLRYGGLPIEEIEKTIGKVNRIVYTADTKRTDTPESPGQLTYHYSPLTQLILIDDIKSIKIEKTKAGLLAFTHPQKDLPFEKIEILSGTGNMREAAANLFSCLHKLDSSNLDIIYAEKVPEEGLGKAIMDRLTKAAKKDNLNFY